jgi:hypothetical protein
MTAFDWTDSEPSLVTHFRRIAIASADSVA